MNKDQLKAAFAKGARIQAWHLLPGATNSNQGQWDTLTPKEGAKPEFGCEAHLYRVHPEDLSLIAELGQEVGAVESFRGSLNSWIMAYPEQCFSEPQPEELFWLRDAKPGLLDRISASMGRHVAKCLINDFDAAFSNFPTSPAHTSEARDAEIEAVMSALDRAYWLGQEYWRLADSQSYSDNRRSDETRSRYNQLVIDTLAAMRQEGGNG